MSILRTNIIESYNSTEITLKTPLVAEGGKVSGGGIVLHLGLGGTDTGQFHSHQVHIPSHILMGLQDGSIASPTSINSTSSLNYVDHIHSITVSYTSFGDVFTIDNDNTGEDDHKHQIYELTPNHGLKSPITPARIAIIDLTGTNGITISATSAPPNWEEVTVEIALPFGNNPNDLLLSYNPYLLFYKSEASDADILAETVLVDNYHQVTVAPTTDFGTQIVYSEPFQYKGRLIGLNHPYPMFKISGDSNDLARSFVTRTSTIQEKAYDDSSFIISNKYTSSNVSADRYALAGHFSGGTPEWPFGLTQTILKKVEYSVGSSGKPPALLKFTFVTKNLEPQSLEMKIGFYY